jgi:hypothetical protein
MSNVCSRCNINKQMKNNLYHQKSTIGNIHLEEIVALY